MLVASPPSDVPKPSFEGPSESSRKRADQKAERRGLVPQHPDLVLRAPAGPVAVDLPQEPRAGEASRKKKASVAVYPPRTPEVRRAPPFLPPTVSRGLRVVCGQRRRARGGGGAPAGDGGIPPGGGYKRNYMGRYGLHRCVSRPSLRSISQGVRETVAVYLPQSPPPRPTIKGK